MVYGLDGNRDGEKLGNVAVLRARKHRKHGKKKVQEEQEQPGELGLGWIWTGAGLPSSGDDLKTPPAKCHLKFFLLLCYNTGFSTY